MVRSTALTIAKNIVKSIVYNIYKHTRTFFIKSERLFRFAGSTHTMVHRSGDLPESLTGAAKIASSGPQLAFGVTASAHAAVREYFVTKPALMNLPRNQF